MRLPTSPLILALVLALVLAGCGRTWVDPPPEALLQQGFGPFFLANHFIAIDADGRLIDPGTDAPVPDQQAYVRRILDNILQMQQQHAGTPLTVCMYIHGGLNTTAGAKEVALEHARQILARGQYPVFVSWRSGLCTNYLDHLLFLRAGERWVTAGWLLSPFVLLGDVLGAAARLPGSLWDSTVGLYHMVTPWWPTREERAVAKALTVLGSLDDAGRTPWGITLCRPQQETGHSLLDFLTVGNPLKLVTAPILDAGGKGAWHSMLRRSALVLNAQDAYLQGTRSSALTWFLLSWELFLQQDPAWQWIDLDLYGHSMGTIVANEILVRHPRLRFRNIVYLAAACRLADLERCVVPTLRRQRLLHEASGGLIFKLLLQTSGRPPPEVAFTNVCLNPYRDLNENVTAVDLVQRGSLLVWLDSFVGEVASFKDRTAGFWFNVIRAAPTLFTQDVARQVTLTHFGIHDEGPQNHGDFSNYAFWLKGFQTNTEVWSLLAGHPRALPAGRIPPTAP